MEPKDNEKFNPWDVTDLDIYLKYCCPECDSQHDTKDFFIHHALLEHPKAGEVLEYPKEKWDLKEEIIESDDYLEDLPSDNLGLIEPEIKIKPKPKKSLKRKRIDSESDSDENEGREVIDDEDFNSPELSKGNEFKCTKCEKVSFISKDRLKRHRKVCRNDQTCNTCGEVCDGFDNLKRHYRNVHGKDKFMCTKCEEVSFPSKNYLHFHRQQCKNYQTCDTCGEICDGFDTLKKHFKQIHPEDKRYTSEKKYQQTCELCGKVLSKFSNLKTHLLEVHGVGDLPVEKCHRTCTQCKEEFKIASVMDEHFKIHCKTKETNNDAKFQCKFCKTEWISHLSLELHIMETHKKEMFSCTECNYVTFKKDARNKHIKSVHENLKHICHHCGQEFSQPKTLKRHLSKKHNEGPPIERKYKCELCDKSYELLESLKTHVITNHDKSVSYNCHLCSSTFLHKQYLHQHVKHVHEKHRPNKCDLCPAAFLRKSDLIRHKELHDKLNS